MDSYLKHHGIKGMKWGVRRYQNKDGSLTDKGKKRYARDAVENNWDIGSDGIARSTGKKSKGEIRKADPNKWVIEDRRRSKSVINETSGLTRELKNANDRAIQRSRQKKPKVDLSKMTDAELRSKINRANLERQYMDVCVPSNVSKGRAYASSILEGAGTFLGVAGSALGIAVALKELKG